MIDRKMNNKAEEIKSCWHSIMREKRQNRKRICFVSILRVILSRKNCQSIKRFFAH